MPPANKPTYFQDTGTCVQRTATAPSPGGAVTVTTNLWALAPGATAGASAGSCRRRGNTDTHTSSACSRLPQRTRSVLPRGPSNCTAAHARGRCASKPPPTTRFSSARERTLNTSRRVGTASGVKVMSVPLGRVSVAPSQVAGVSACPATATAHAAARRAARASMPAHKVASGSEQACEGGERGAAWRTGSRVCGAI